MRESQKMSLDYKLHTKIIESIIMIQRWFKTKIQKEKFTSYRSAAIKIQSFWRMHLAQNQLYRLKLRTNAAILIQSTFRMFRERRIYKKLLQGLIIVQAHIRGKYARVRFKRNYRQKVLKERYKLRPTQSLPINERSIDSDTIDVEISRSYPKLVQYSFDLPPENVSTITEKRSASKLSLARTEKDVIESNLMHKAENQFRSLLLSSKNSTDDDPTITDGLASSKLSEENIDNRGSRAYNIDYATKQYFDNSYTTKW